MRYLNLSERPHNSFKKRFYNSNPRNHRSLWINSNYFGSTLNRTLIILLELIHHPIDYRHKKWYLQLVTKNYKTERVTNGYTKNKMRQNSIPFLLLLLE